MRDTRDVFTLYYYGIDRNAVIESFDSTSEFTRRVNELKERDIEFKEHPVKKCYQTMTGILREYRFEATDVFYSG